MKGKFRCSIGKCLWNSFSLFFWGDTHLVCALSRREQVCFWFFLFWNNVITPERHLAETLPYRVIVIYAFQNKENLYFILLFLYGQVISFIIHNSSFSSIFSFHCYAPYFFGQNFAEFWMVQNQNDWIEACCNFCPKTR